MTKTEVLDLLKENRDARGEANWKEMGGRTGKLTSFGIVLTTLQRPRYERSNLWLAMRESGGSFRIPPCPTLGIRAQLPQNLAYRRTR